MDSMNEKIQKIIDQYPRMIEEEAKFEKHLAQRENADMRDALTAVGMQINVVESWFSLLDVNERFVLRQMLTGEQQETPAAQRAAARMWLWQTLRAGQTPWQIRASAVDKIACFANAHEEAILAVFATVLS